MFYNFIEYCIISFLIHLICNQYFQYLLKFTLKQFCIQELEERNPERRISNLEKVMFTHFTIFRSICSLCHLLIDTTILFFFLVGKGDGKDIHCSAENATLFIFCLYPNFIKRKKKWLEISSILKKSITELNNNLYSK